MSGQHVCHHTAHCRPCGWAHHCASSDGYLWACNHVSAVGLVRSHKGQGRSMVFGKPPSEFTTDPTCSPCWGLGCSTNPLDQVLRVVPVCGCHQAVQCLWVPCYPPEHIKLQVTAATGCLGMTTTHQLPADMNTSMCQTGWTCHMSHVQCILPS
jgi:hypothetical protein